MTHKPVSKELSEFARVVCRKVKMSPPGIKLACKRLMGRLVWCAAQATAGGRANWRLHVLLRMQRFNFRLPKLVSSPLRSLLARLTSDVIAQQPLEDWSTPLIMGRNVTVMQVAEATAERTSEANSTTQPVNDSRGPAPLPDAGGSALQPPTSSEPAASLRCLLATGALDVGGMDEVVVFLASRLPQYGFRTAVLHTSVKDTADGVPTGRLGRLLVARGIETVELAGAAGARWLRAWRPDVISAHDPASWVLDEATRLSIPYVDTLHGLLQLIERDRAAEAARGQRLARIVAVSELERRRYLELNPTFPPERAVTIPNGVDDWRRIPSDRERARARWGIRDEYVFVSLARCCQQKNTYGLVAAFEDVAARHPEAHLVIAGRPDTREYLAQVVRLRESLGCRHRIHLRDHTSNPSELLALADGFVLDSFYEGWSLASMEALHAGVPVVLSEVGGASEQVGADKKRGYLVPNPAGDPLRVNREAMREVRFARQVNRENLVQAMSCLITNRASYLAARQRLADESAARFHPDVCLRNHASLLAAAAKPNGLLCRGLLQGDPT
jgi:glycosyltransferase involved in cell wall biosynthesis